MEVVPTNDGDDDDGVVWYRCPQCQGFLPKLKGAADSGEEGEVSAQEAEPSARTEDEALPWDSPSAMMKELEDFPDTTDSVKEALQESGSDDDVLVGVIPAETLEPKPEPVVEPVSSPVEAEPEVQQGKKAVEKEDPALDVEPIMEYAAMLADLDVIEAAPYRPWEVYEVGQCINHLAWNDCGVVVSKEDLPGGRKIIKCYFEEAGVVRLIEKAPR